MDFFIWKDEMSVNVEEIDQQHKKLVSMINELHKAMKEGKSKVVLGDIIKGLLDYTKVHFGTEEKYFDKFGYPESEAHIKEHNDFVKKVQEFQKQFEEGKSLLSIEILNFLKDWLYHHIMGTDKKYSKFFNDRGLK